MRLEGQRDKKTKKKQRLQLAQLLLHERQRQRLHQRQRLQLAQLFLHRPTPHIGNMNKALIFSNLSVHEDEDRAGTRQTKRKTPPKGKEMDELINFFWKKNIFRTRRQVPGLDKSA